MSQFAAAARRFARDETGATMAEYALLIAVIAIVAVVGASKLGGAINTRLDGAATKITTP